MTRTTHLGAAMRKVSHRRAKALALDGGDPLVVVVRHEVAIYARLQERPLIQLLHQQSNHPIK